MNYDETMDYITNAEKFGINFGLKRTERILEVLGNPHKSINCIHIAGTNGKGSTTAMINCILIDAGYKVGMYTSPYIEEFEERIQINSVNIPKDYLAKIVTEVKRAADITYSEGLEHPTEFEIITCAAFLYFYYEKVDFAVVEVGLGGRLDSTNVINPILSIITSISYDHMQILGDDILKIASEKAGIIKKGIPVVLYPQISEVNRLIEETCEDNNCDLYQVWKSSFRLRPIIKNDGYQYIHLCTEHDDYQVELPLLGKHQILNCATAVIAMEVLIERGIKIEKNNIINGLKKVRWIGRMEVMGKEPLIVIDGAHNRDGIMNLKESIDTYFQYTRLILILGILADKQVEDMIEIIAPKAYRVITVTPHSYRAELAGELEKAVSKYNDNCEAVEDYKTALKKAMSYCNGEDLLLISGSLYMIGDMRKIIRAQSL